MLALKINSKLKKKKLKVLKCFDTAGMRKHRTLRVLNMIVIIKKPNRYK